MVDPRETTRQLCAALAKAGIDEPAHEVDLIFQYVVERPRLLVDELTPAQLEQMWCLIDKRVERVPLQYLFGRWPFLSLELQVGPGVLIPRPETEEVCLAAVECVAGLNRPVVLDLCSGTGALALGLQSRVPMAEVTAVELMPKAFCYLEANIKACAKANSNSPQAVLGDALVYYKELNDNSINLLVSNPPYVTNAEYLLVEPELLAEPREALVAENNGLQFYACFIQHYLEKLKPGGWMVFEIGCRQGQVLHDMMCGNRMTAVKILKDIAGNDRIALGQKSCDS